MPKEPVLRGELALPVGPQGVGRQWTSSSPNSRAIRVKTVLARGAFRVSNEEGTEGNLSSTSSGLRSGQPEASRQDLGRRQLVGKGAREFHPQSRIGASGWGSTFAYRSWRYPVSR